MHTTLLLALVIWSGTFADDVLRPAAIIPWSQYQQRMRGEGIKNRKQETIDDNESSEKQTLLENYRYKSFARPTQNLEDQLPPSKSSHSSRSYSRSVIRPQIRNRLPMSPAEPSDFTKVTNTHKEVLQKLAVPKVAAVPTRYDISQAAFQKEHLSTDMSFGSLRKVNSQVGQYGAPTVPPPVAFIPEIPGAVQHRMIPKTQSVLTSNQQKMEAIPHGVPLHAGTWENNEPHYVEERKYENRKPAQFAANTIGAIDPQLPLTALNEGLYSPQQLSAQVPATGNIVNSIFAESRAAAVPQIQTAQINAVPSAPNAIESLLANGAPLDQFSKIARNLLSIGGGSDSSQGGGNLIDVMTNALRGPRLPPLTSSAAHDELPPLTETRRAQPSLMENLLNQAASALNQSIKDKEKLDKATTEKPEVSREDSDIKFRMTKDRENSLKLLEGLPDEQKKLLEAAITSGELDAEALGPALKSLVKEDSKEDSKKEKESRLIEWIRANRPTKTQEVSVTSDKLPYYGKYCGRLAEQNSTKPFQPAGAVWAVDDKRLIISKFYFKSASLLSENVTFWLGPNEEGSNPLADSLPSDNGFYIRPQPLDISIFSLQELPPMVARAREGVKPKIELLNGLKPIIPEISKKNETIVKRRKRDATVFVQKDELPPTKRSGGLVVHGGVVQEASSLLDAEINKTEKVERKSDVLNNLIRADTTTIIPFNTIVPAGFRIRQPEFDQIDYSVPQPLEWYAGFQPLLLTLPPGKSMKKIHWVSLRDHKRQETIASVLMPNTAGFQVPAVVSVRPFTSNGAFNVKSGPIRLLDIKTIEISNFTLRTEGSSVWFMVGKDILPNTNGHIVPLYDEVKHSFDCDSLRDYFDETVVLRLPGSIDMKDVFWFSVFSIPTAISQSHLYLPYNDLQLPADLSGIPTPSCKYQP